MVVLRSGCVVTFHIVYSCWLLVLHLQIHRNRYFFIDQGMTTLYRVHNTLYKLVLTYIALSFATPALKGLNTNAEPIITVS